MKQLKNLYPAITTIDNLYTAYKKARKGKQNRMEVARFSLNLEKELTALQAVLITQSYRPGDYRLFTIYERKPRQIAAAPFRDRVVHHAIINILEPAIDPKFIFDSYACRKDKGVHKAVMRYQNWSAKYPYVLKLDISRYFPSIDHLILKQKLACLIKDKQLLWLLNVIIDTSPKFPVQTFAGNHILPGRRTGIPIGNLTSQFFANLYLNDIDHMIKETLNIKPYLRYVDDLIILARSKSYLWEIKQAIDRKLLEHEHLLLHPRKVNIYLTRSGVDVLGYRVFPEKILLRNDNGHHFQRKLRGFAKGYTIGKQDFSDFSSNVQSWIGHASFADTEGLRTKIFSATIFRRESA